MLVQMRRTLRNGLRRALRISERGTGPESQRMLSRNRERELQQLTQR